MRATAWVSSDEEGFGRFANDGEDRGWNLAHLPGLVAREAVLSERAKVAELREAYGYTAADRLGGLEHHLRAA